MRTSRCCKVAACFKPIPKSISQLIMKKYLILLLSLLFLTSCTNRVRECEKWNQGIIVAITKYGKHGKVLIQYENNVFKLKKWKYPTLGLYMTEVCKCEKYVKRNK